MKLNKIATLLAGIFIATFAATAQDGPLNVPQQWTIVTTSESVSNAVPINYTATGTYSPCTTGQGDNPNVSNPSCFNPLTITADWTVNANFNTVSPVLANTYTNSICTASGGVQSFVVTGYKLNGTYSAKIVVTMLDSNGNTNTVTFTGASGKNSSQFSGSFASTGSCMNNDKGNFTATLFSTVSGTFNGTFEASQSNGQGTGTGAATLVLATDSNFNITGTVVAGNNSGLCFSNMTIASTLANSYMSSFATGDTLDFVASDVLGNVVLFTATGTDGTGTQLGTDSRGNQKLYLTYYGLAGSCSGITGVDTPFTKDAPTVTAPRHGRMFGNAQSNFQSRMAQFRRR